MDDCGRRGRTGTRKALWHLVPDQQEAVDQFLCASSPLGFGLIALGVCYWITDIKQWRGSWTKPFLIFGSNAIAAYTIARWLFGVGEFLWDRAAQRPKAFYGHEYVYQRFFSPLGSQNF